MTCITLLSLPRVTQIGLGILLWLSLGRTSLTAQDSSAPLPSKDVFAFAIVADPHINGDEKHDQDFQSAIDWIIQHKDEKKIDLIFIVGDIGWGAKDGVGNLQRAKTLADALMTADLPYVPLMGDNEIQDKVEAEFSLVFASHYERLSGLLHQWQRGPVDVNGMHLQNFSFDHKGCHFICPDFLSRKEGEEGGDLQDVPGGSWEWFKQDVETCQKDKKENIVMVTHVGLFSTLSPLINRFLLDQEETDKILQFLEPHRDHVWANYSGHLHREWTIQVPETDPVYEAWVTNETWQDPHWPDQTGAGPCLRIVTVDPSGETIRYDQSLVWTKVD